MEQAWHLLPAHNSLHFLSALTDLPHAYTPYANCAYDPGRQHTRQFMPSGQHFRSRPHPPARLTTRQATVRTAGFSGESAQWHIQHHPPPAAHQTI